eukprot:TRINITY_DN1488_c0_g1_i4.p3 TRINITY_DN1488_c0_g1~~TRINITY_DN1488_c0_g1_i4.p3  ORF type:complete len:197 (-),score=-22.19 TRINITY_DN1488_c0_g1_i4:1729-2289(-)
MNQILCQIQLPSQTFLNSTVLLRNTHLNQIIINITNDVLLQYYKHIQCTHHFTTQIQKHKLTAFNNIHTQINKYPRQQTCHLHYAKLTSTHTKPTIRLLPPQKNGSKNVPHQRSKNVYYKIWQKTITQSSMICYTYITIDRQAIVSKQLDVTNDKMLFQNMQRRQAVESIQSFGVRGPKCHITKRF